MPLDFLSARVAEKLHDDYSDIKYSCTTPDGDVDGLSAPADIDFNVDDALNDIRDAMSRAGQQPWSGCSTLFADRRFKFDVTYHD